MEDSVEAAPSEDNGNIPLETPSEPTEPVVPTETEPVTTAEPQLYELPDGRKVDAETLTKEWKDNFLPDYTRKSQELAAVKAPINNPLPSDDPFADPNYIPKSYAEVIQAAEQRALKAIETREADAVAERQAVKDQVATELETLKKADKTLDENALFVHANKYGFRDLAQAHQNMKDMATMAKTVQQTTAKNIAKRNDPVSVSPGATGARPNPSNFASARDYLRSLNT